MVGGVFSIILAPSLDFFWFGDSLFTVLDSERGILGPQGRAGI